MAQARSGGRRAAPPPTERLGPVTANDARPDTLGEILDRTIATYGRRWFALFVLLAVAALPVAALQAAAEPSLAHLFASLNRLFTTPPGDVAGRTRALAEFANAAAPTTWSVLYVLAQLLLFPLAQTAAFAFVEHAGDAVPFSLADAYRAAFPRWPAQVLVLAAFLVLSWLLVFAFVVVALGGTLATYGIALLSRAAGSLVALALAGALCAAFVLAVSAGYLAWLLASASVATEGAGPLRAIRHGVRRTLDPALRRRTLAVAPALLGVNWLATLAVVSLGGLAAHATHVDALLIVLPAFAGIVIDGLRIVFVQSYARDVQLRREGRDLLLAASALPAAAPSAADDGLDPAERELIEAFLARRTALEPAAVAEIAGRIAARVRPKLRASFHYLDDIALLEHLSRSRG